MLQWAAVSLVLVLALGYWVFTAQEEPVPEQDVQHQALLDRKKAIYDNLKDLHFEQLAGKLNAVDFERARRMLEGEAAAVIAKLDRLEMPAGSRHSL